MNHLMYIFLLFVKELLIIVYSRYLLTCVFLKNVLFTNIWLTIFAFNFTSVNLYLLYIRSTFVKLDCLLITCLLNLVTREIYLDQKESVSYVIQI